MFQRLARTALRIDEDQIVTIAKIRERIENLGPVPIVFVDDFVGSGEQFITTWNRLEWADHPRTLSDLTKAHALDVYYLPLLATAYAVSRLSAEAPEVHVRPSHILSDVYNALDPDTIIFPDNLRAGAKAFIDDSSQRAGLTSDPYGFHELGLDIAFEHSIPDACVALLWSKEGGWVPLMEKK